MAKSETSQRDLVENDGAPGMRVRPRLSRHRSAAALDDEDLSNPERRRLFRRIRHLEEQVEELKKAVLSRDGEGS